MDWASPTALFQATMCRDHPGGWKCLQHQAQSYLAVASIIAPSAMGRTPIQVSVSHTGWALCWTAHLVVIHFVAMLSQRQPVLRGRTCPQLRTGASAGGRSDRLQHRSPCLQMQRFSKMVITALAGIITKLLSNRSNTLCREQVVI